MGLFFFFRLRISSTRLISASRPITGSIAPRLASSVKSVCEVSQALIELGFEFAGSISWFFGFGFRGWLIFAKFLGRRLGLGAGHMPDLEVLSFVVPAWSAGFAA